ncbi:MAG: nucleotidyltransferase family protein [Oscillospiraceae bacterium]|nr:nucleotidyltransferase family protein [Oscillospiraceae bacterium]
MKAIGIICEYNPFHRGHARHIELTRRAAGPERAIVCVMSGNFTQRGDYAIFNKHARAEAAIHGGADLVIELPVARSLSSSEGFATAGVYLLDMLGACDCLSFGSESGDVSKLAAVAEALSTPESDELIRGGLAGGAPYAAAVQKAADALAGEVSVVLKSPNNLLGIEYIKAISALGARLTPMTIKRAGGEHDGSEGLSASAVRKALLSGEAVKHSGWSDAYTREVSAGRGPVSMKAGEQAIMSRLRALRELSQTPGAAEGLDSRLLRCAGTEPTVEGILAKAKTRRYAMSRLRRMLLCACIGITKADAGALPQYIRVLAANGRGLQLLREARGKAGLPVITKPASALKLPESARAMFMLESAATDFYSLAYPAEAMRMGGLEWRTGPVIVRHDRAW